MTGRPNTSNIIDTNYTYIIHYTFGLFILMFVDVRVYTVRITYNVYLGVQVGLEVRERPNRGSAPASYMQIVPSP